MPGIKGRDDEMDVKRAASIARINEIRPEITIYTDGSADGGCKKGGAAAVITTGDAEDPQKVHVIRSKGAAHTCSMDEERQAMEDAIDWAAKQPPQRILICTDSQSLCRALVGYSDDMDKLRRKLAECASDIVIQWVPGHSDIPGNEMADLEAKAATEEPGDGRAISMKGIKTVINSIIKDGEYQHQRIRAVYACKSKVREKEISIRADQRMLAQVRCGHCLSFNSYKHRLNERENPTCPRCEESSLSQSISQPLHLDTLEHWLECDATAADRMRDFGKSTVGLEILTAEPRNSATHARRTLHGATWA